MANSSLSIDFKTLHLGGVQGDWEEEENCPQDIGPDINRNHQGPKNINRGR